jgi:hypothetical protein
LHLKINTAKRKLNGYTLHLKINTAKKKLNGFIVIWRSDMNFIGICALDLQVIVCFQYWCFLFQEKPNFFYIMTCLQGGKIGWFLHKYATQKWGDQFWGYRICPEGETGKPRNSNERMNAVREVFTDSPESQSGGHHLRSFWKALFVISFIKNWGSEFIKCKQFTM